MKSAIAKRLLSSSIRRWNKFPLIITDEVKQALNDKVLPVVSLESTIITHGMAYPQNLEMAQKVEQTVRDNGGIPATIAFIEGKPHVGLSNEQLVQLAEKSRDKGMVNKVSRRDIGYTMARKLYGGTTIASTMILSHMAGIKVFATGGLGGVHYEAQSTFDISADLNELGRTPVAVVCSGPKSILDIGLTIEYLETQGVCVSTYNDDNRPQVQIPGFYTRESGIISPDQFQSFQEIALALHYQNNINSGSVICVPIPKEYALPSSFINELVKNAIDEAKRLGIQGKELTPFLLQTISNATAGKSVDSNISLVLNNAKIATSIAKELLIADQTLVNKETIIPKLHVTSPKPSITTTTKSKITKADVAIVGSVAYDTISKIGSATKLGDSNIGFIQSSIGGVGHNVNLACQYSFQSLSKSKSDLKSSQLVSIVSNDLPGSSILNELEGKNMDSTSIKVIEGGKSTAQYVATHDEQGELIVACADMSIIETDFSSHIINELDRLGPKVVVFDCNLSPKVLNKVFHSIRKKGDNKPAVIIEPTSFIKSSRIASIDQTVFPNNVISLITPTRAEMESIHKSFTEKEYFNDFDNWFPILDALGISADFREKLNALSRKPDYKVLSDLLSNGDLQRSFQLLPYVQNILLKLGKDGLFSLSISETVQDYKSIPTASPYKPKFMLTSFGQKVSPEKQLGIVMQYFPIPPENENLEIVNVTGAGDSLLGTLVAKLVEQNDSYNWLNSELISVEQEWHKWESIYQAQISSGLTLMSNSAVSEEIAKVIK